MPPRKDTENIIVTTASLPVAIKERWDQLEASKSFKNFNSYVNYVILHDVEEREKLERMGVIVRPPAEDHSKEE